MPETPRREAAEAAVTPPVALPRLAAPMPVLEPTARAAHHQNAVGDVVVPLERGEIVTLPRLWGFDLRVVTPHEALLRTPDGLLAEVSLDEEGATVDRVFHRPIDIRETRGAA